MTYETRAKHHNGQISAEFLTVLSALLVMFLIVYQIYLGQNINLFQTQDSLGAMRNAYMVSTVMNYVYLGGNGASYNFTVSGKANDENITISKFGVESVKANGRAQAPILDSNINATSITSSMIQNGTISIKNNNGAIEVG